MINKEAVNEVPRFATREVERGYVSYLLRQKMGIQEQIKALRRDEDKVTQALNAAARAFKPKRH